MVLGWEQTPDRREQNAHEDFGLLALLVEAGFHEHGARYEIRGNWWRVLGLV